MENEGISRWRRVGDALVHEISQGLLTPGEKLPAEVDLADRFGVARQTIRRAISHLQNEGLLRVEHGRGTFVTDRVLEYRLSARKFFEQSLFESQRMPSRELISKDVIPATEAIAGYLAIDKDEEVLLVVTIGRADGTPVAIARNYFPVSRLPKIEKSFSPNKLSVSDALRACGVASSRRHSMRLRARAATREEARLLGVEPSEYLFETNVIICDLKDVSVLYSITSYSSSRVEFVLDSDVFKKLGRRK